MLKVTLLATAAMISSAAAAQTAPAEVQTAPAAAVDTAAPPADEPTTAAPAATPAPTEQATTAQPATGGQVAQIVETEFPTYDKNSDGKLDKAEFSAWMVALKSKADPSTDAKAQTTVAWVSGAFTQADADKNKGVSKPELTSFLSQGAE